MGVLLGLAAGDALGCDIENKSAQDILQRNQGQKKTEITGGANGPPQKKYNNQPYRYRKGEMTDDTAMPIILGTALIQSLSKNDLSTQRQRNEFLWNTLSGLDKWIQNGAQGTGRTTRDAARNAKRIISNSPRNYLTIDPKTACVPDGNGNAPLTRGIPLVLTFAKNKPKLEHLTEEACRISHGAPEAVAASLAYNFILADILNGAITNRSSLEYSYKQTAQSIKHISPSIARDILLALQLKDYGTHKEYTDRYIGNTLRISLWAFAQAFPKLGGPPAWNLETAITEVANKGGDTDSNAAVTGALYGAYQGKRAVPSRWYNALLTQNRRDPNKPYLYYREDVENMAKQLYRYRSNVDSSAVNPPSTMTTGHSRQTSRNRTNDTAQFDVLHKDIAKFRGDVIIINLFEGVNRPRGGTGAVNKAMGGVLMKQLKAKQFKGKLGETAIISTRGMLPAKMVIVVGLGQSHQLNAKVLQQTGQAAAEAISSLLGVQTVGTLLHGAGAGGQTPEIALQNLVKGMNTGFRNKKRDSVIHVSIVQNDRQTAAQLKNELAS